MRFIIRPVTGLAGSITNLLYGQGVNLVQHLKAIVIIGAVSGLSGFFMIFSMVDLNAVDELQNYTPKLPSQLLDRKGRLISTYFQDNRILVKLEKVPDTLVQAFVATEDNHFYSHFGLDFQAVLRAFLINLQSGSVKQGGSTITQQLAKVILTDRKRTYIRKAKEAILSIYLDAKFSKEEILAMYLNQIYFGHGNYGVEAAAQFYFSKTVDKLRIGESAILASLPSAPNGNSPIKNPRRSIDKMAHVLMKMVDMAFITRKQAVEEFSHMEEYYAALNISPTVSAFGRRVDKAPYFTETVRRKLEKDIGRKLLYEGGLTIYSSLDLDHQRAAQAALWPALKKQNAISRRYIFDRHVDIARRYKDVLGLITMAFDLPEFKVKRRFDQFRAQVYFHRDLAEKVELLNLAIGGVGGFDHFINSIRDQNPFLNRYQSVQGALVEVDHHTGEVTAMVGGLPFSSQNQVNRVVQMRRQPGSAFKPLIYAAAMENKSITAATIFPDSPIVFLDSEGGSWMPENYSGGYRGFISVREALAYSTNLVSVAVAREAGLSNILPTIAKQLHVPEKAIPYNLSVALGTYEVTPLQLATAFSLFPRGGVDFETITIKKVVDYEGNVIRDYAAAQVTKGEQVFSTATATIMTSLLHGVVHRGTGGRARYPGYSAGKTGTTQNFRDAWFTGFNRRYTAAVWMGYDRSTLSLGPGQAGGNIAAPVWGKFQRLAAKYRKKDKPHFHQGGTETVKICRLSGNLPGSQCRKVVEEIFIPGSAPEAACEESHGISIPDTLQTSSGNTDEDELRQQQGNDNFISDDDI